MKADSNRLICLLSSRSVSFQLACPGVLGMATTAGLPVYMLPGVPIRQPTHLEGDSSLATEILPGPPSFLSAQQSAQKRDPRKPSVAYSYLPPKDPGSTYSGIMHGTLVGQEFDGPPTKRSRIDRRCVLLYFLMYTITCSLPFCCSMFLMCRVSSRAQRASARRQLSIPEPFAQSELVSTPTPPAMAEVDPSFTVLDDEPRLSRTISSHESLDVPISTTLSGRPRRKDKGKAREVEPLIVKVKEEPKVISLHSPEPPIIMVNSQSKLLRLPSPSMSRSTLMKNIVRHVVHKALWSTATVVPELSIYHVLTLHWTRSRMMIVDGTVLRVRCERCVCTFNSLSLFHLCCSIHQENLRLLYYLP